MVRRADVSTKPVNLANADTMVAFFDGGAANKYGTGGFVVYNNTGTAMHMSALWYGKERHTVNEAEATELLDLMNFLACITSWEDIHQVVIFGDSRLVIDFMNQRARLGKSSLYLLV